MLDLKEKLASKAHDIWAQWTNYFLYTCGKINQDGSITIPKEFVDRWTKQIQTNYLELTEKEKDSDREIIEKYLDIIFNNTNCTNQKCIINRVSKYFESGNEISPDRATILKSEWDEIIKLFKIKKEHIKMLIEKQLPS